ncbi:MAG: 4-hydroxy-3-methylbut-2-enyl diphosphate reductase [Planctomycetota bacterium]
MKIAPSDRYYPKGFGLRNEIGGLLKKSYHSQLVEEIRCAGNVLQRDGITFRMAKEFGFCYGVDRAVEYAYEALQKFPGRRIFLANEIIHNPHVNERLKEKGVIFLHERIDGVEGLREGDVVIIPAFGVTVPEMDFFREKGCIVVDTTCGSVMNVWKNVDRYGSDGFTAIIHGKATHEETKATCSRLSQFPEGRYLVVRNLEESEVVCRYIEGGGDRDAFLDRFRDATSVGFDPDRDLVHIGVANQTTMLSRESLEIAGRLREAMIRRHGEAGLGTHFRMMDTICRATQERQDAVLELIREGVDLMLVIGGYNSSNTSHLLEIASARVPAYHIDDPSCIVSLAEIRHKPVDSHDEVTAREWFPGAPCVIGITAGASTPNNKIGEAVERILMLRAGAAGPAKGPSQEILSWKR